VRLDSVNQLGQIELQKALQGHVNVKEVLSVRIGRNPVGIGLLISDILGNEEIVHVGRSLAKINDFPLFKNITGLFRKRDFRIVECEIITQQCDMAR